MTKELYPFENMTKELYPFENMTKELSRRIKQIVSKKVEQNGKKNKDDVYNSKQPHRQLSPTTTIPSNPIVSLKGMSDYIAAALEINYVGLLGISQIIEQAVAILGVRDKPVFTYPAPSFKTKLEALMELVGSTSLSAEQIDIQTHYL